MPRIGRYELEEVLGEGGAGRVHKAELVGPGGFRKLVALKVLHRGGEELRREARIGGLLRHPNLVDVYEIGEEAGQWFCALELCAGSLSAHLPLPPRAVVEVGLQVCAALQYAHEELGLIHLDIKPENLLLSEEGVVKVADLGIALAEGFDDDGRIRGTPGYMPPEQAQGRTIDARADVYALGVALVELATGSRAGPSETMDLDFGTHPDPSGTLSLDDLDGPYDEDTHLGVPNWLSPAVSRCLESSPEDRWPSMAALAEALQGLPVQGESLRRFLGVSEPAVRSTPAEGIAAEANAFVGRTHELEQLEALLREPGIVTLKGPAGIGKTRLARAALRRWGNDAGGHICFCDLSDTTTLDGLFFALARTLDVPLGDADPEVLLARAMAGRGPLALVFDNFEQIVDLAPVLDRWAESASQARLLVTSRVPLGTASERVLDLHPLDEAAAISLLTERARQRGVDVAGDPLLPELARRLDGLPLALELAAGRLGVLSVREVFDRLSLGLLRTGSEGRHGTLSAALQWSWELLSEPERAALSQLSVFAGGFTVESAEDVVEVGAEAGSVLDLLDALVHRSMVAPASEGRFHLLMSIQEFAADKLGDDDAEVRHGRVFAHHGSPQALEQLRVRGGHALVRALAMELDNLVVASRRAMARSDGFVAAATALAAWEIYNMRGPIKAGIALLYEAHEVPDLQPAQSVWMGVLLGRALKAGGQIDRARTHLEGALRLSRVHGIRDGECRVHSDLGELHMRQGRTDAARRHFETALVLTRELGNRGAEGRVFGDLGMLSRRLGRIDEAGDHYKRALLIAREVGDRISEGRALGNLGVVHANKAEMDHAREHYEASLAVHRRVGDRRTEAFMLSNLANLNVNQGRHTEARAQYIQAVQILRELGNRQGQSIALGNLGTLLQLLGDYDGAREHYSESIAIAHELGDTLIEGANLANLAGLSMKLHRLEEAWEPLERALMLQRKAGNKRFEGGMLGQLGDLSRESGEPERARAYFDEGEAILRQVADPLMLGGVLCGKAELLQLMGEREAAVAALAEAEAIAERAGAASGTELGDRLVDARAALAGEGA